MQWIDISERLPNHGKSALVENRAGQYYKMEFSGMVGKDWYERNLIRWLDEEINDPVFSLEDMKKCWDECDSQHCQRSERSIPRNLFATFIQEQYKIEIP